MIRVSPLLAMFVLLSASVANADAYAPPFNVNGPLNVNLATLDNYDAAFRLTQGANGDAIMMWQSGATGARNNYIQRYDAVGRPQLNPPLAVGIDARQVALAGNGNYAILSELPDGSGIGVFLTVFNRANAVVVPRFRVNDTTTGDQRAASFAVNAAGMMAVAWLGPAQGQASCPSLYVKRFQANGAAVASEALIFQTASSFERLQGYDLAIDASGNYTIAFAHGDYTTTTWSEVWAQRFAANGTVLQGPFQVNTSTNGAQQGPQIAMSAAGSIIVWTGDIGGGAEGLFGQRYAASGAAVGGELRISPDANAAIEGYGVALDSSGGFVVTWHDDAAGIPPQIVARTYTAAGAPLGDRFVVSSPSDPWPTEPQIGMDAGGNFLIAWQQHHYTTTQPSNAFARRYAPAGVSITPLANGQLVSGLAGATNSWRYFKLSVPTGQNTVEVSIAGGSGDADLYLRWGALPTLSVWDGRPYLNGNSEGARMLNFPPGDWYIGVQGYNAYGGLSLQASSR